MLGRVLGIVSVIAAFAIGLVALALHDIQAFTWIAAVFTGACVVLVFYLTVMSLQSLFSWVYGSPSPPEHQLQGLAILRPWWGELIASTHTFFYRQRFLGEQAVETGTNNGKPALLLIHGYFCNRALWRGFATEFARDGHMIDAVNLEPVFGSIDTYAPLIHTAVQSLRERSGQDKIVLIGHSMGGLAIRAYLRDYGSSMVRKAITLGTPHQGTWIANLGHGKNVRQMRQLNASPPNVWLKNLRHLETPEQDQLFEILLSHHDNIVFPQATQTLGLAPIHEFSGMGHIQMVYATAVRAKVRELLAKL